MKNIFLFLIVLLVNSFSLAERPNREERQMDKMQRMEHKQQRLQEKQERINEKMERNQKRIDSMKQGV